MTVVSVRGLRKVYGRGRQRVEALCGLDLDVASGRVTGLIGPNGAGKSTFIKLALGFLVPTAGQIEVLGRAPGDPRALARLGYLPEHPNFPDELTGIELLRYVGAVLGLDRRTVERRAEELLAEVGLAQAAGRRIRGYSKGMQQRLGLAQALLGEPELLVLDEPMSGLDPLGRALVKRLLRARSEAGVAILFCSHILEDVERLCDDVVMLARGRIAFQGSVSEVLTLGEERWQAVVRAEAAPELPGVRWRSVGPALWSAEGLDAEATRRLAERAAGGELELVRLERAALELEELFVRLAAEVEA